MKMETNNTSLTDNEIIKVWAKCLTDNEDCSKCPLLGIGCHEQILDILNRQKAEKEELLKQIEELDTSKGILISDKFELLKGIESLKSDLENYKRIANTQQSVSMDKEVEIKRLKAEVERLEKENHIFADIGKMYSEVKAEAVKEFAHKIESYKTGIFIKGEELIILPLCDFEDIKSEMVGEDNA